MAKNAAPATTDAVGQYGRSGLSGPRPHSTVNEGGFLAQVSANPFFTAVSETVPPRVH